MTQAEFLKALRAELLARYPWAADATRLDRFVDSVHATLVGGTSWNHEGEACTAAWQKIGGTGKVTLKKLRALP